MSSVVHPVAVRAPSRAPAEMPATVEPKMRRPISKKATPVKRATTAPTASAAAATKSPSSPAVVPSRPSSSGVNSQKTPLPTSSGTPSGNGKSDSHATAKKTPTPIRKSTAGATRQGPSSAASPAATSSPPPAPSAPPEPSLPPAPSAPPEPSPPPVLTATSKPTKQKANGGPHAATAAAIPYEEETERSLSAAPAVFHNIALAETAGRHSSGNYHITAPLRDDHSVSSFTPSALRRGSISGGGFAPSSASRRARGSRAGSVSNSFQSPSRRASIPAVPWNANSIFQQSVQPVEVAPAEPPKKPKRRVHSKQSARANASISDEEDAEDGFVIQPPSATWRPHVEITPAGADGDVEVRKGPSKAAAASAPTPTPPPQPSDASAKPPSEMLQQHEQLQRQLVQQLQQQPPVRGKPAEVIAKPKGTTPPPQPATPPPAPTAADGAVSVTGQESSTNVCSQLDEDPPTFCPPLYIQRALFCLDTLKKYKCYNFMDAGCSDGGLLQYMVKSQLIEHSFRNVVGIDLSMEALNQAEACLPFPASSKSEYLHRVRVELVLADLTLPPPLLLTGSPDLAASQSEEAADPKAIPTQCRPWLQMDRHFIRQQQQQQPAASSASGRGPRSSGGLESAELSYNDLGANFGDDSPVAPRVGGPTRTASTIEDMASTCIDFNNAVLPAQQPMDAVLSIEVLEHVPPHLVASYTDTIFAQLAAHRGAKVVVITTPNRSENARFAKNPTPAAVAAAAANKGGSVKQQPAERSIYSADTGLPRRRHPDHFFELTPAQFRAYCDYVVAYFSPYWESYELVSLGENFTQGAVFISAAGRQALERRQRRRHRRSGSSSARGHHQQQSGRSRRNSSVGAGVLSATSGSFQAPRMSQSLGQWDVEFADTVRESVTAGDGTAPQSPRNPATVRTIVALRKGRHEENALRKRVAQKAAVARRQSVGGGVAHEEASAKRKAPAPSQGKRAAAATGTPSAKKPAHAAAARSPGHNSTPQRPAAAAAKVKPVELAKPLPCDELEDDDDDNQKLRYTHHRGDSRPPQELDFDATFGGVLGCHCGTSVRMPTANTWTHTREERLAAFPFEAVFGMSESAYRAEFTSQIAAMESSREARRVGADPAFASRPVVDVMLEEGDGIAMGYDSRRRLSRRTSLHPTPSVSGPLRQTPNYGYVSIHRTVLPAVGLWDRLCDAMFNCAQNLYCDLLSACYTSRRSGGSGGGGGGWATTAPTAVKGTTGMLTREGVLFGELVLQRERATAFKPLQCTVCAVLTMLEAQRRLWNKNFLGDLRRWYGFTRVRRIPPNSAFTMLSGLITEVLPAVKHVSYAAAAAWANGLPADCVVLPSCAAYTVLKSRPYADQKEGAALLKDLRLSQSGTRVHTWLIDEIVRHALAYRRSNPVGVLAGETRPDQLTADDIFEDDQTRLDTFLPDDVALVLLFMAAVDALPRASVWLKERVPRWTAVGADGSEPLLTSRSTGPHHPSHNADGEADVTPSMSRRRRLHPPEEHDPTAATTVPESNTRRSVVDTVPGVGAYTSGGSSGLVGSPPSSNAALLLASSLSTFRVDANVLEHLLGPPEGYIRVAY